MVNLLITLAVIAFFVLIIWSVSKLPGGCSGDCYQGRKKCNCNTDYKREMFDGKTL